ncbi:MAG: serine/threonine-protein kinase, partial [Myxococcota bacterium]
MGLPAQGCPDESALDHYVRGTGSAEQRAQVEGHLSACDLCTAITAAAARVATAGPSEGQVDGDLELPAASERYEWIEAVGHGAMGVVYAAFDQFLDRKVAIKVIRGDAAPKQASQRRSLLAESRALARVTHPNVVTVHDVGLNDGELFIAMEFVDGASLRAWLAAEARGRDEILDVFLAALAGLAAVHDAGLVHRDFKPDNVLVGRDGAVKVTDFGLVRGTGGLDLSATPGAVEVTQTLTGAGGIIGTPAYLAPELFDGAEATASSDQFACCVALFEALYGARPFDGPTMLALAEQVASGAIREPPGADVPAAIASVIRRGLAVDPDARHSSVGELAARLLEARRSPARRRRARLVLAAAATISVTGAVAVGAEAPVEACEGTEGVDPWATSDRAVVARALGNEVAPLFEQAVPRWADLWSAARRFVCRKTLGGERDARWRLRADA